MRFSLVVMRFATTRQAAAGLGFPTLEVLIHGLHLTPAVTAAQPAGVAMGVAGYKVEHSQAAEALVGEVLGRTGHLSLE